MEVLPLLLRSIMATNIPESTRLLQGYRICFTSVYQYEYDISYQNNGVDVLSIFQAPQSDREAFLEWWANEKERAVRDRVVLVVVSGTYKYACQREWLRNIEEEVWLDNDEGGGVVRFTTWAKFCQAIDCGVSLTDSWGDVIEKMGKDSAGASASDDIGADDDDYSDVTVPLSVFKADDLSD
jgi:hypothetical protein